jgi:hypothetical protein
MKLRLIDEFLCRMLKSHFQLDVQVTKAIMSEDAVIMNTKHEMAVYLTVGKGINPLDLSLLNHYNPALLASNSLALLHLIY